MLGRHTPRSLRESENENQPAGQSREGGEGRSGLPEGAVGLSVPVGRGLARAFGRRWWARLQGQSGDIKAASAAGQAAGHPASNLNFSKTGKEAAERGSLSAQRSQRAGAPS